ncbi:ADP-ribosyl cyclase/cyclic ADP-ribose hydrolase 1 [Choloepus didactylus]|uniref:ADP-ribosyl cyclase/cyclic ADP-ribose hydrolase 1 n=1 Tax=Choloepus didactylus TaxID=27675 RepID=UPI0018A0B5DB|nr:ADP-ribosyl cyclase/cyclic ADP-ribose hydrolase 1 [Choloepus didactylus]
METQGLPAQESGTASGPLLSPRPADPAVGPMEPESAPGGRRRRCLLICLGVLVLVICAVAAGILWPRRPPELSKWRGRGSTPHFSEIVLGRCFTYTQIVRPELKDKDCQEIWNAFKNAFVSKNQCNITEEDYQPLMELADQTLPCNKSLFWSRTYDLAHRYTQVQSEMFTLEDTLLGYLADGLTWCGDAGTSEMNYQSCPDWREDCSNNPYSIFWKTVSKRFAEAACGMVYVMLNGSRHKAFDKNSVFGSVEIFNLQPKKVHTLQAWVMHDIGRNSSDSCSGSSINDLRSILSQRDITFTCQNDYRPVRFLQCVSHAEHSSCSSEI